MRILILSRKFEIYSTRRLVEEIQALGHTALLWDPAWPVSKCATSFDALIPRLGNFQFPEACMSLEELSFRGGLIMNDVESYKRSRNKWRAYLTFLENQLPTPFSECVLDGEPAFWSNGFPCIVKILESSKGEGVFLASSALELTKITTQLNEPYLIQEAFPESFGEDIRAFVLGGKIIACMKRKSATDFRSNLALGGVGEPCILTQSEEEMILKTTATLKLKICGVDLLRSHKGSLIIEANPCPGLEGIEKFTQVNVGRAIIKYIEDSHDAHINGLAPEGRTSTHI